jgi:hypothetical protein
MTTKKTAITNYTASVIVTKKLVNLYSLIMIITLIMDLNRSYFRNDIEYYE